MRLSEIKNSLLIVWAILTIFIFFIILSPFVLQENTILKFAQQCQSKIKHNSRCSLCGFTTGFLMISRGKFNKAVLTTANSLFLYIIFITNELVFALFLSALLLGNQKVRYKS